MKHNRTLRRGLGVLLALVMCLSLLPATALAAEPATATADFTTNADGALALLNGAKTEGAADSEWDPYTSTLTLNGVNFTTTAPIAVELPAGATIYLAEGTTNTIASTNSSTAVFGIRCQGGSLNISGGGSLTINVSYTNSTGGYMAFGIYAGSVTMTGGTVNIVASNSSYSSYGVFASEDLSVTGGHLTANITTNQEMGFGLCCQGGEIAIGDAATVDVTVTNSGVGAMYGIYNRAYTKGIGDNGNINLAGTVTVTRGSSATGKVFGIANSGNGYNPNGVISVTGGSVTVTDAYCGISTATAGHTGAFSDVVISGGTVNITSSEAHSRGIVSWKNGVSISGGAVTVSTVDPALALDDADNTNLTGLVKISGGAKVSLTSSDSKALVVKGDSSVDSTRTHQIALASGGSVTIKSTSSTKNNVLFPEQGYFILGSHTAITEGDFRTNDINAMGGRTLQSNSTSKQVVVACQLSATPSATVSNATVSGNKGVAITDIDVTVTLLNDTFASTLSGSWITNLPAGLSQTVTRVDDTRAKITISGTPMAISVAAMAITIPANQLTSNAALTVTANANAKFDIFVPVYPVRFNANGGSGEMTAVTDVSGSYTLPECGFTAPSGKQFKGWATSATGEVISGPAITVTEDTTLYAIWEDIPAATYTVRFNANGGSGEMDAVTGVSGSYTLPTTATFTAPSGKQFAGWATSADGEVITGTTITVTEDTTLYAVWAIPYGVTVNDDVAVTDLNKDDVLGNGLVRYDPDTNTVYKAKGYLATLTVAGNGSTDVVISSTSSAPAVGALTVTGAKDVTVTANSGAPAISGEANITCTGNVTITNSNGMAASAPLTVDGAQNVTVEGSGNQAIAGKTMITCSGNVTIANSTGMAVSNQLTVTGAKDVTVTANSSAPTIAGEADITCSGKVDITNSTGMAVNSALTVNKAKDVTVIANSSYPAIGGTADITCSGKVDITNSTGMAVSDALTVKNAKDVTVTANTENTENTDYPAIGGKADITCSGDVTISNSNSDGRAVGNGLTYQSTGDHGYTVKTGPSLDSLTDYAIKEADQVFEIESLDAPAVKISVGHTADEWHSDSTQHWQVCTVCGEEFNRANHTFIGNTCTVCGYTKPSTGGGSSSSGGGSSTPTYAPTVTQPENGTVTVSPKAPKKGDTVTITPKPEDGYTVEQILVTDKNGDPVKVTDNGDGTYSFTQPAGKVTVKVTFMEDNSMLNFFVDVPANAYYYDAVLWAAKNGITGGVDDTHFAPDAPCTRAQIVTFLWRAAGSPEPETVSSFADVPADAYYAKAVAWAVENGITTGTGDGMFSPDATCTRAQAMAFIWRSQKSVAADGANPFTDVAADAYYADAVLWAVENGITNGTSGTTFSPNSDCTRAQIVTFLYRCLGEE